MRTIISTTVTSLVCLILFSGAAYAESYFCVAEASAGVEYGGKNGVQANIYNVSDMKFIQTNESGTWQVKRLGDDYATYDKCSSIYFCERKQGYTGVFMRDGNGTFTATMMFGQSTKSVSKVQTLAVAVGKCSKISLKD